MRHGREWWSGHVDAWRVWMAAEKAARQNLKNQGGGELTTMNHQGRIRSKDICIIRGKEATDSVSKKPAFRE